MKVYVVGKKKSEWTDLDKGEFKQSAKLFYTCSAPPNTQASSFEGRVTSSIGVPFDQYDDFPVDCDYNLDFKQDGKLMSIDVL